MGKVIFEEIQSKSLINRVSGDSLPFRWTVNPYRGCQHACVYCFARSTHTYLGMNAGKDFDTRVSVKVNAPEVLRQELRASSWRGQLIALGTACDPYEPAEQKYRLTRGILQGLSDFRNPVSITTKGTLIERDVDILKELSQRAFCSVNFSVGTVDSEVWKATEPLAPKPVKRLQAMEKLVKAGVRAGVMLAPILPGLSDSPEEAGRDGQGRRGARRPVLSRRISSTSSPDPASGTCPLSGKRTRILMPSTQGSTRAPTRLKSTQNACSAWWRSSGSAMAFSPSGSSGERPPAVCRWRWLSNREA